MSEPLAIYLEDHSAGAHFATTLLENLRDQHAGEPLGEFAAELLEEIREDHAVLVQLHERIQGSELRWSKPLFAWLGEKTTRLKLHRRTREGLGTLQKLETLSLGILGKLALWTALGEIAGDDARLRDTDFERLASRARTQHADVEARRLEAARSMFAMQPPAR